VDICNTRTATSSPTVNINTCSPCFMLYCVVLQQPGPRNSPTAGQIIPARCLLIYNFRMNSELGPNKMPNPKKSKHRPTYYKVCTTDVTIHTHTHTHHFKEWYWACRKDFRLQVFENEMQVKQRRDKFKLLVRVCACVCVCVDFDRSIYHEMRSVDCLKIVFFWEVTIGFWMVVIQPAKCWYNILHHHLTHI
jgi:hypothetical protein